MRYSSFYRAAECLLALALMLPQTSCKPQRNVDESSGQSHSEAPAPPAYLAANVYRNRCASCHGATGAGDGPAAAGLNPRPRNFTDPDFRTSATDVYLRRVILEGGSAVGKSLLMPPAPDLATPPAVFSALIAHVHRLSESTAH